MDWRLNRALSNFRSAVNARWPDRDKTSDGTIGDVAHQATTSDHNPDSDGSVDAWDMDVDGVDVQACIRAALAHESIQYVIYNRRITSRSWGLGTWRTYDGANPHDRHVHFNTRSSHEDSTAPWVLEGDDMTKDELIEGVVLGVHRALAEAAKPAADSSGSRGRQIRDYLRAVIQPTVDLEAVSLEEMPAVTVDYDRLADAIVRRVLTPAAD